MVFRAASRLPGMIRNAIANASQKPDTSFLVGEFDKEAQKKFSKLILKEMGYDFDAGRLDRL